LDNEPAPLPPRIVKKKGIPLAAVALGIAGLLVAAAGATVLLLRGSAPITAEPRLDSDGNDLLHLRCESCQDGTVVDLAGSSATFHGAEADLPLKAPLHVGDNPLALHVDRPGMGRDETVSVVVPVSFRIRADLATLGAPRPTITVRVEATPGTQVQVDGQPVSLDANGHGAHAIDISQETEGPSDESRTVSRSIPYAVTPKHGAEEKGAVAIRAAVVPLRVDAPGTHAVIDAPSFVVSGRAAKGGTVTVNGQAAPLSAEGAFEAPVQANAVGDVPVEVRAESPPFAPRTIHLTVKRVESLEGEVARYDDAVSYDAVAADVASHVGKTFVVEGEVEEARVLGQRTVVLATTHRGCARGKACLVRVVLGRPMPLRGGDGIRAYGRVAGSVAGPSGKPIPEVEADFAIKGRK
jgi:hypothetical protein